MTTHYISKSRGPIEIATMNSNHLFNAERVLTDMADPTRQDELDAIRERIIELDAEYEAEQDTQPGAA